ncbi:MAG: helix-turn-helix domain-containing protein [Rhodopirellula sp.]|nr:helix-turn-helix domain-containing protein [Rhodopirellula sp.]
MAQKFYNLEKAAEMLGMAPADLNKARERNEIRAFRDGADWKFRVEDVENLLTERVKKQRPPAETSEESDDVLLSQFDMEGPAESSGTVIGPTPGTAVESDIQLAAESDLRLSEPAKASGKVEPGASTGSEDLDLTLDEDFTFEDSQISLQNTAAGKPAGDSAVQLGDEEGFEDDDLVLGGSGSGSDITIGGDSGISLVDPTDSGLSLEEPIEFSTGDDESLELGEDDMLSFSEATDTAAPTELKADDDFLLTPLEDAADDDSESGSQVIALDTEGGAVGPTSGPSMAAMLDEDVSGEPGIGLDAPLGGFTPTPASGRPSYAESPVPAGVAYVPEAPYSTGVIVGLAFCALFLAFAGMMSFDLLRNMWSWQEPYTFNSALMDMVLGLFG